MNYKGYNIAIHEMGHNVEQVFSLNGIDHWFLNGVPNNAFTEALAFVFQGRDLELLGLASPSEEANRLEALDDVWGAYEIGGVALVDMRMWRWMYAHPEATPAELKRAVRGIARDVWNKWYAPVLGRKDVELLAVYSHMVSNGLYLPDYPLGHVIASQLARAFREGDFGRDFERVCRQGRLTPDAWMKGAVGASLSSQAMLAEARRALSAGTR
jgi:oligoendopeptidase F